MSNVQSQVALVKRDTIDVVADRIRAFQESGELHLPGGYSAENAMKSAWLILQSTVDRHDKPVLLSCTRDSIANSLLDMVIQGLNPAKNQCYFIAYGKQLVCQRSYFGDIALVKRVRPDADVYFNVVYEGDNLHYTIERGRVKILRHEQALENVDPSKIRAAYCVIEDVDGNVINSELMTMAQIRQSWMRSKQYKPDGGNTPHHTEPDQMALRTVIRRTCKPVINASSDDYLLFHSIHRSELVPAEAEIEAEAAEHANGEVITVEPTSINGHVDGDGDDEPEPEDDDDPAVPPLQLANEQEQDAVAAGQQRLGGPDF